MTFNGFPFLLCFLPLVLCGYAVFSRFGAGWAKSWLILASLAFYAAGAAAFVPLLVCSVGGNFILLRIMHGSVRAGRWAAIGVAVNLAVLGWFKYLGPDSITPLGLSFFTFTQIGCLLHHAGGDTPPPKVSDYVLFVAFFPVLLAGPILNPREMLPQFARNGWRLTANNLAVGSGFFLIGLLKKTLLADPLSAVVSAGFTDPAASDAISRVAGGGLLFADALFRFLRVHRHGDRSRLDGRAAAAGQFRPALPGAIRHLVLAALAHVVDPVSDDQRPCATRAGDPALAKGPWPPDRRDGRSGRSTAF